MPVNLRLGDDVRPANAVKFHLALNVSDLSRSLKFYRILFGCEPARSLADYARFDLGDPPLILSLRPLPHGRGGALDHLGFCVSSFADLLRMQATAEAAGFSTQREDGVECCHSRQTKFWVADPDANQWEIYIREAGEDGHESAQRPHACAPPRPVVRQRPLRLRRGSGSTISVWKFPRSSLQRAALLTKSSFAAPSTTASILRDEDNCFARRCAFFGRKDCCVCTDWWPTGNWIKRRLHCRALPPPCATHRSFQRFLPKLPRRDSANCFSSDMDLPPASNTAAFPSAKSCCGPFHRSAARRST